MFNKYRVDLKKKRAFAKQFDLLKIQEQSTTTRFILDKSANLPYMDDATATTGFDRHYVYHPAWAARIVAQINPSKHIDVSSTLHFCSILSAFLPVDFYDYRPANLTLSNLNSLPGDLLNLPFESNSIESISCMHTIEHIGLSRYGDPLDYDGDIKAINELKRVVRTGGSLLLVTPMGAKDVICFNAHRIYSKQHILNLFSDMKLEEFAFIPEDENDGGLVINPSEELLGSSNYGCGCFWFTK